MMNTTYFGFNNKTNQIHINDTNDSLYSKAELSLKQQQPQSSQSNNVSHFFPTSSKFDLKPITLSFSNNSTPSLTSLLSSSQEESKKTKNIYDLLKEKRNERADEINYKDNSCLVHFCTQNPQGIICNNKLMQEFNKFSSCKILYTKKELEIISKCIDLNPLKREYINMINYLSNLYTMRMANLADLKQNNTFGDKTKEVSDEMAQSLRILYDFICHEKQRLTEISEFIIIY
jgi:hypothetical protein